ncbi:PREDICTED: uncharacterized protein LOC107332308 [Acropora digitifera]|uniref:uncharacterized protein LOC107332308 n=1 Tax=Acropora digitifera TaxID=70779 RepID=UPI00077AB4CA|nr:PREDICTED: uncharacterized protein LOC107332308 [Acropora digitifera]
MPTAKSQRSSAMVHSDDEKLLRTKDVVIHMSSEKRKKCRCCEKRLMALPLIGFTLFSIACLLGVGYFSVRRVTSSVYHTEGVVPSYAIAGLVSRLYCFVWFQFHKILKNYRFTSQPTRHLHNSIQFYTLILVVCDSQVVSSLVFTVVAGLLCFSGALFTGTEVAPLFSGIDTCQYYPVETSCKCFHHSELRQVSIIFRGTVNCKGIQFKLSSLVYGMSGVYAGGVLTCIIATVMETMFLCRRKPSKTTLHSRSDGDGKCTVNSQHSQTSPTDLSTVEADGEEENEEVIEEIGGATGIQRSTIETQTSQSSSSFVREAPCTHYVVDLNSPRRDYVINYNSNSRHDPPPPYSEM